MRDMRELLYTKYRLDYAYFEIVNQQRRQVDASAFSMLENKLIQPEQLRLPGDSRIDHTRAYYFDTESNALKLVQWNYSVENDARGYVESRFREVKLQTKNAPDFLCSPALLEILKQLLQFTYQACSEKSSVFLKIDSNQLFENLPNPELLPWFLQIYYLFLPSEFAERVIFINQYADTVRNLGAFPVSPRHPIPAMRPEQEHSFLMQILHETENQLEYQTMLHFLWNEFFACQMQFDFDSDPDSMQEFETIVRLWEKVRVIRKKCQKSELSDYELASVEKLQHWFIQLIHWLIEKLCDAKFCPTFRECLQNYKKILRILQKQKNEPIYHALYQTLQIHVFQQTYLQDQETCLRDSYRILSDPETAYLPEDLAYYTAFCFSCVNALETVPEIYARIASLTDGNMPEFFDVLAVNAIDLQALKAFYLRVETETIRMLQEYSGYCRYSAQDLDTTSGELRNFLELAVTCADFAGYDFRQTAFEQYAKKCRNHIRMQYFADYFLYPSITLTELLNFFADWQLQDFYAGIHPAILDKFLFSLQYSRLSQHEKKAFLPFLQQYQAFRNARQENPDLLTLCEAYPDFMQLYIDVFNVCQSREAGALLLFLNKTILGDPVIVICLLELYFRSFLTKQEQKKYDSYDPFYELLLQPLFQADQLSLQDLQYLIWIVKKNNFLENNQNKIIGMKLFQNLEQKFTKTVSAPVLSRKQQAFRDFPEMLLHRLSTDYALSDPERQSLRDFLELCHADHRKVLCQEEFQNHAVNHMQWLKKYSIEIIKNF
ncbi:MAG: hypothetical protein K2O42_08805 [Oscillospiraceae bacterium]|nr:hypothetical protein [Oscillospiraceae bacterium]